MTQANSTTKPGIDNLALIKRMALSAGIYFMIMAIFLLGVKNTSPEWPKYWQVRPLVVIIVAGAGAGAFSYLINYLRAVNGWNKVLIVILTCIVYFLALWMGSIFGLDGTLWD